MTRLQRRKRSEEVQHLIRNPVREWGSLDREKVSPRHVEPHALRGVSERCHELLLANIAGLNPFLPVEPEEGHRWLLENDPVDFLRPGLGDVDALLALGGGYRRE